MFNKIITQNQYFRYFVWTVSINFFVTIIHIISVLSQSFRIIECFEPILSRFLIIYYNFASNGSLAYKLIL